MLGKIRCLASEIYSILGTGHNEIIYHKAMELELRTMQVPYVSKAPVSIYYKNHIVGYHEPDIIIYNNSMIPDIVIELKASTNKLRSTEQAQLLSYMRNLKCDRGILINFPQPSNKFHISTQESNIDFFHVGFCPLDTFSFIEKNTIEKTTIEKTTIEKNTIKKETLSPVNQIPQIPLINLDDNEHS